MHVVQIDRLTVDYSGRTIFQELSWSLDDHARIGLVGPNGAGKSSLFKVLIGAVPPTGGAVTRMRGVTLGYLPQDVEFTNPHTLWEEARTLPPALAAAEDELAHIEAQIADPAIYGDSGKLTRVLERQAAALERFTALGGDRHDSTVRALLVQIGFTPEEFNLPVATLSGGQKKMLMLVKLIIESPTLLLLDEPDNHLDMDAKRKLEAVIRAYAGGVIVISHDRYLLDEVAHEIAALEAGKLTVYPGNYTAYVNERALRRLRQQQQYVAQQKEITRIEVVIARFEMWAKVTQDERHIKQARSRRRMLDKMEERGEIIERVTEARRMDVKVAGWRGSRNMLQIKSLSMGFGDELLFVDLNYLVQHGARIGLVGDNGAGKSVLFKLVMGELQPLDGEIRIGPSVKIGYYAQEHQTLADWLDRTAIERLRDLKPMTEGHAVSYLGKFALSYQVATQPIGALSGGERSRVQLAALLLTEPNLLLLDEPTNNLDLPSVEALEEALEDFQGAILTISHDRYFLDRVVDQVVELADSKLTPFEGGYTDYLAARQPVISHPPHAPAPRQRR